MANETVETATTTASVLDQILESAQVSGSSERATTKDLLEVFADEVVSERIHFKKTLSATLSDRIADIDAMLSSQISEILHNAEFQKLEASWRGLYNMVKDSEPDQALKIRILDATKEDIMKDAEMASNFDETGLFKLIYEQEYGTFGGAPYGMLVGDYYFGKGVEDLDCLKAISQVAAAAHAPFVAAAGCELFGLETFDDLHKPKSLERMFASPEYGRWNQFRELEDSKYVVLTMPKTIMREAYGGPEGIPVKEFRFEEEIDQTKSEQYLWGNAAFHLSQLAINSYREYGWFSNIRGVENGGMVRGLPAHFITDEEGNKVSKVPVEVCITDRREKELDDLGLLPLVYKRGTDSAVFFGSKTVHHVPEYDNDLANANAQLAVQLPYLMAVSRFAHYLKVIMRDKVGGFTSRTEVEGYLNNWVKGYVVESDVAPQGIRGMYPLREAKVEVVDVPGKPGAYRAVMSLRPHFYLNELTVSLRLVTQLGS